MLLAIQNEEDKYLVGNPQITFFKAVYKRHTNFALDPVFVNYLGDISSDSSILGRKINVDIPKNGDLLHRMYVVADIDYSLLTNTTGFNVSSFPAPLAYSLIEYVELFIGSESVDKQTGEWLYLRHEQTIADSKKPIVAKMVSTFDGTSQTAKLYIPLRFWFNEDVGLSLPLIALQNTPNIRLEIKFNTSEYVLTCFKAEQLYKVNGMHPFETGTVVSSLTDKTVKINTFRVSRIQLLCDYIHLDTAERRLFASHKHEYLITQLQTNLRNPLQLYLNDGDDMYEKTIHRVDLRFKHPVREIVWTIQDEFGVQHTSAVYEGTTNGTDVGIKQCYHANQTLKVYPLGLYQYNYWRNYTPDAEQMIACNLVLDGKDMTEELPATFFRHVQNYQYHQGHNIDSLVSIGSVFNTISNDLSITTPVYSIANNLPESFSPSLRSGAYSYSFSLYPEATAQPSGSLNFSRLDKVQLKMRLFRDRNVKHNPDDGYIRYGNFTNDKTLPPRADTTTPSNYIIRSKTMNIYALSYNVLRIESGLAGLLFTQ